MPKRPSILSVARKHLGFEKLRPGQQEAIEALLNGQDTLVVQPTGSGKSAIYRIAGLMQDGAVLVVSPLIALQKDQVDTINQTGSDVKAVLVNSSLKAADLHESTEEIAQATAKYIFLAPEQLAKSETIDLLKKANVTLIAIDEAHCISEWGHDFRPDYMQLGHVVERLGHPPTLAMTATASEPVREEIIHRLELRKPKVLIGGFDRPNIQLRVDHFASLADKREAILHHLEWAEKPGIVYVGTRKGGESLVAELLERNIEALVYHAGLKAADRDSIQQRFMDGEADVIVATNAFGMGIDKSNIRFVYHFDAPDSLDAYYQEIGRAGRDGNPSEAILFFRDRDIGAQAFHTGSGHVDEEELAEVAEQLLSDEEPVTLKELAEETELSARKLTGDIQKLEDVGAVHVLPSGELVAEEDVDPHAAAVEAAERQLERKDAKKERLEKMREYAVGGECRRQFLLRYFGDDFTGPCGNCDVCGGSDQADGGTRREVA